MHSETIVKLERDMIDVIESMEKRGLNIDLIELENLIQIHNERKQGLTKHLCNVLSIDYPVNFNSSKDVGKILQTKLGVKPTRTSSGRYSTKRSFLRSINNPITDAIIKYRDNEQLLSTLKAIYVATDKSEDKLFCTYVDDCPSGRLYTKNYSFQSFPEVARGVVYAQSGFSFILADYDSFELRILSALSGDTYFKDCWARGLDLHKKVVSDMKSIPYDSVTTEQRQMGKVLNFGLAYGQEASGLARTLHTTIHQAQTFLYAYKGKIPAIEEFKQREIAKARNTGFSETYYGRKRFLSDINSYVGRDRKKAERRVINHKIQGTGADIVKQSLVKLHEEGFNIDTMIHDGILMTVKDDELDQRIRRVKEIMEQEISGMKFIVTCKVGKTWGDCNNNSTTINKPFDTKLSVCPSKKTSLMDKGFSLLGFKKFN